MTLNYTFPLASTFDFREIILETKLLMAKNKQKYFKVKRLISGPPFWRRGVWIQDLCLLGSHSTSWPMLPTLFTFSNRVLLFFFMLRQTWTVILLFILPVYLGWQKHATMPSFIGWDGVLLTFCLVCPQNLTFLISSIWVARITGASHHAQT
jgi:hypothetical protein